MKRILLIFRGDLADVVALHWLRTRQKMTVYTYTPLVGGAEVLPETAGDQAMRLGAESAYFGELREKLYRFMLVHAIRAGLRARNGSYLVGALTRPLIAKEMTGIAEDNGCRLVGFVADPFSLDQLRYNSLFAAIAPGLQVLSVQAQWPFRTLTDLQRYARRNNLPQPASLRGEFQVEQTVWGGRVRCGRSEDLWKELPEGLLPPPSGARSARTQKQRMIDIEFEHGLPVGLNGTRMDGLTLLAELHRLGHEQGIGRMDVIEEELLGIKTRIYQEAPAAQLINAAHKALEDITLSNEIVDIQEVLARHLCRMIYQGNWFTDLREAICDFFTRVQGNATGVIRMRLSRGQGMVVRRKAPAPVYKQDLLTQARLGNFPVGDIAQFLNVWKYSKDAEQEVSTKKL